MRVEKLISMSAQIATFFRSYPREEAVASVRKHVVSFWTPAMLELLEARVAADPSGVDPLVVAAMRRHDVPDSVIDRSVEPAQSGMAASDAG